MRKVLGILLIVAVAGISVRRGDAAPRLESQSSPVHRNDGETRVGIAVSCGDSSWTTVAASRATRRRIFLVTASGGRVCLATATMASGTACDDSTLSVELGTAVFGTVTSYEDSNEGGLTCRARAGNGPVILKGFDEYDSRD